MECVPVSRPAASQRYLFIGCEVFYREICYLTARSPHMVDHLWVSQGLHDLGAERMQARLQEMIAGVDAEVYDAVLLGYALCNNGVVGLSSPELPLVIPRAHDCITLFLGSRERYQQYFDAHPGTYYLTTGWMERDESKVADEESVQDRMGMGMSMAEIIEKYGEENAAFIAETLGDMTHNYNHMAYIAFPFEEDIPLFEAQARSEADRRGWSFERLDGDLSLLQKMLAGKWDDDFLVLQPGNAIRASFNSDIICACSACPASG